MFHRYRFVLGALLVVLASAVLAYGVWAIAPNALRPAGTTRYAVVQDSSVIATSDTTYTPTGLQQGITIPSGKVGDVFVSFCAPTKTTAGVVWVRAKLGGAVLSPGTFLFHEGNVYGSNCANFYKLNAAEGTRTVKIEWAITGGMGTANMYGQSMIITVNIH